jgi:hypothetical protein
VYKKLKEMIKGVVGRIGTITGYRLLFSSKKNKRKENCLIK